MSAAALPTVNIDDIQVISQRLEVGKYRGKLLQVVGEIAKKSKNPMVVVTLVVTEGPGEGEEAKMWHSLAVSKGKNGKSYAGGLIDLRTVFARVGKPLPAGYAIPAVPSKDDTIEEDVKRKVADTVAALYAKRLNGLDLEFAIKDDGEQMEDDGKTPKIDPNTGVAYRNTRTEIIGLFKKASAVSTAASTRVKDEYDTEDEE